MIPPSSTNGAEPDRNFRVPEDRPNPSTLVAHARFDDNQPILYHGNPSLRVVLPAVLTLGRSSANALVLDDPSVSRQHARIERKTEGFWVIDLESDGGSLINGRNAALRRLIIGDLLQIGPYFFRFDGTALERTVGTSGVQIDVSHVGKSVGDIVILNDVSLHIGRGQFVAILGPSGSGKSSLLDVLTGLRPSQQGQILFDGLDFYRHYDQLRTLLGYVPQDDIVHRELTVLEALRFSARLRLPAGTPGKEIDALVAQTIVRLGLDKRINTPVAQLSGGQRKRVSVGVELLGGPAVLFLDEPTSGLDPRSEFELMALLRDLANGGRTVVCTTHVMENVYLTDRTFVIASGHLVFAGSSTETKKHFGIKTLAELYDRLDEESVQQWCQRFVRDDPAPDHAPLPARVHLTQRHRRSNLGTLLHRQWAILAADWKNFFILFGQPLIIALLVAWLASEPQVRSPTPTTITLFFAYLATLWFGTSNAAQEIVRELPVYRRERMVGLDRHTYLLSKFIFSGTLTVAQGTFLYGCLRLVEDKKLIGSSLWQVIAICCTALASVGIGFAISAFCRTAMQAVMIVPLILIPQILFSGFVVSADQMTNAVYYPTSLVPSYAAQTLMDQSILWQRKTIGDSEVSSSNYLNSYNNLELQLNPAIKQPNGGLRLLAPKVISSTNIDGSPFVYEFVRPGLVAAGKLLSWMLLGYGAAWCGLRAKERG